ncbi:MAG: hypothetical protein DRH37_11285 [Deltaproteobacteria bacterium]|nr:MAG: hypothetical protein DRH37_11285 [Deltaproteobacteria bacterium]
MTTAFFRKEASKAESYLNWESASLMWSKAIDCYPKSSADGGLGKLDIERMRVRKTSCDMMAIA